MFIYHFNRLIRSRLLWLVFAVIVAFAFLSVGPCTRGLDRPGAARAAGRLGGRVIDADTYRYAEIFVHGADRGRDAPPAMVETQIWEHLAALQTAGEFGLSSTPEELRQSIRENRSFSIDGRFDASRYRQAIAQSLGVTPGVYEHLMADQIALQKLSSAAAAATWVSPMELDDEVAAWTDQLTLRYVVVSNRFAEAEMPLDEAAERAYYEAHRERFALPDRVGVQYATLSVSNFLGGVSVPEEDIEDFYDSNASRYTHTTTNDTLETLPLAAVRDEIVAELALDEARFAASTNAAHFVEQLGRADLAEFTWRAKARGMLVRPSPVFGENEPIDDVDDVAQQEFHEAAFDLDPARLDARFAVVRGDTVVYILQVWTNSPAHVPPFEAVRDKVTPLVLAEAREEAFTRELDTVRDALASALTNGLSFAEAATAQALNVSTSLTFSAQSVSPDSMPYSYALLPAALRLRPGALSEPAHVPNGAALLFMESRRPADPLAAEMIRPQLREALARRRANLLLGDWMRWNLKRKGFAPARGAAPAAASDTDGEEEPFDEAG